MNILKYIYAWYHIIKCFFADYWYYKVNKTNVTFARERKYAIIFLAANYNNLGDVAITFAQEKFLKKHLGDEYKIVKVYDSDTYAVVREVMALNKENVVITLIGGGNNGSIYEFLERPRRFILWMLKDYRIISFPQSVYFESALPRLPYMQIFKLICNRCQNLTLVARERLSYERYLEIIKAKVILTPDIVFTLEGISQYNFQRNGVALILRDDIEKELETDKQNNLIEHIKQMNDSVYFLDTCDVVFTGDNAENLIEDYLMDLSRVKYAITDRLHGMILCYLCGTPCIVIDNNNKKISSTYNTWLTKQNFVKMYNKNSDIMCFDELVAELTNVDIRHESLNNCFLPLERILKNERTV